METQQETIQAVEAGATRQMNRSPRGIYKGTREEWLEEAMRVMGEWINEFLAGDAVKVARGHAKGTELKYCLDRWGHKPTYYKFNADKVRVSCSLQDGGLIKSGTLAHIHYSHATGNKKHEIRMSVELGGRKLKVDSMRVADVLLHEMVHSCAAFHGHKGAFKHIAQGVGLTGKMTATRATDELNDRIKSEIVDVLGKYPHAKVRLVPRGQRGKGSRSIKVQCVDCEFTMRTTRKWIDQAQGLMVCPLGCSVPNAWGVRTFMTIFGYDTAHLDSDFGGEEE